jgi:hypothetical protein
MSEGQRVNLPWAHSLTGPLHEIFIWDGTKNQFLEQDPPPPALLRFGLLLYRPSILQGGAPKSLYPSVESLYCTNEILGVQFWCFLYIYYLNVLNLGRAISKLSSQGFTAKICKIPCEDYSRPPWWLLIGGQHSPGYFQKGQGCSGKKFNSKGCSAETL